MGLGRLGWVTINSTVLRINGLMMVEFGLRFSGCKSESEIE